jgi:hypothetical protein
MARRMRREERKAAFLRKAEAMFEEMEAWYDEHPAATFGEIEAEARQQRRGADGRGARSAGQRAGCGQRGRGAGMSEVRGEDGIQGVPAKKGGRARRRKRVRARLLCLSRV